MDEHSLVAGLLERDERYQEALRIARENSKGEVMVVGGYVARTLTQGMYGTPLPAEVDIDFLCRGLHHYITVPAHLHLRRNGYGNPRITGPHLTIDLMPLSENNFPERVPKGTPLGVENVIDHAPLTVGSIAFDPERQRIIGEVGILAVKTKTVAVHSPTQAAIMAARTHRSIEEIIAKKAASYGFTPVFPTPQ